MYVCMYVCVCMCLPPRGYGEDVGPESLSSAPTERPLKEKGTPGIYRNGTYVRIAHAVWYTEPTTKNRTPSQ